MFSIPDVLTPSGYGQLDSNGDRILSYDIYNVRSLNSTNSSTTKVVATLSTVNYTQVSTPLYMGNSTTLPLDSYEPLYIAEFISSGKDIGPFILILFCVGVLLLFLSAIGLLIFRKNLIIRFTGLSVNSIMLLCLILGILDMLLIFDVPTILTCYAKAAVFPWAISIFYGLLYVKNKRIQSQFYKFETVEADGKMSMRHLWPGFLFVIPNLIIWAIWIFSDPPIPTTIRAGPGIYRWSCESSSTGIGHNCLFATIIYNAIIVLMNVILAFKSRNVDLSFRETKMMNISSYNLGAAFILTVSIVMTDFTASQTQVMFRALGVFYVISVNCAAIYFYKFFLCRKLKDKKAADYNIAQKGKIKYRLPKTLMGASDQILPAVVFVKRIDGINSLLREPEKKLVIAGSPILAWVCDFYRNKAGDSLHAIKEVGEIWMHTQLTQISLHSISASSFELSIGSRVYEIVFEKEASCLKWKGYFSLWMVGIESPALPSPSVFLKSREVDIDD